MNDGESVPATSVPSCQNQCINNPNCTGVDWDPSQALNSRCWVHGSWSGSSEARDGVSHYIIDRAEQDRCPTGKQRLVSTTLLE